MMITKAGKLRHLPGINLNIFFMIIKKKRG